MYERKGEWPVAGGLYVVGEPIDVEPSCADLKFFRCLARVPAREVCSRALPDPLAMWVGGQYTCHEFRNEARKLGVRKRIPRIPAGVQPGQTVALLHSNAVGPQHCERCWGVPIARTLALHEPPERIAGVFDGFRITGFEVLVPRSKVNSSVIYLCKKYGVTLRMVEPDDPRFGCNQFSPPQFLKAAYEYAI